jgi:hypothetical protein
VDGAAGPVLGTSVGEGRIRVGRDHKQGLISETALGVGEHGDPGEVAAKGPDAVGQVGHRDAWRFPAIGRLGHLGRELPRRLIQPSDQRRNAGSNARSAPK